MCYILRCNQISQRLYRLTDIITSRTNVPHRRRFKISQKMHQTIAQQTVNPVAWFNIKALFVCQQQVNAPPCVLPTPFGRPVEPEV